MKKKNNNNNEYEDFASFATRQISILTKISGHLKGIFSHNIIISYMYILTYLYILAEISAYHLHGWSFLFQAIPT